jgi:hypothetical protein
MLTSPVLSTTIATRLLGQRVNLEYDLSRRGAAASQRAIALNTLIKATSLTVASLIAIIDLAQTVN